MWWDIVHLNTCCDKGCVTASLNLSRRSRPMSNLRPSVTTVKLAADVCKTLLLTGVRILTSMRIVPFENIYNCGLLIFRTHIAIGLLFANCSASDLVKMLHALPESPSGLVELFLILTGMLRGSFFWDPGVSWPPCCHCRYCSRIWTKIGQWLYTIHRILGWGSSSIALTNFLSLGFGLSVSFVF